MRFLPNWLSTDFKPSSLQLLDIAYIVVILPLLVVIKVPMLLFLLLVLVLLIKDKKPTVLTLISVGLLGAFALFLSLYGSFNFAGISRLKLFIELLTYLLFIAVALQRLTGVINIYLKISPLLLLALSLFFFHSIPMLFYIMVEIFILILLILWQIMQSDLRRVFRVTSLLFLSALPWVILLFIFFPRISFEHATYGFKGESIKRMGHDGTMHLDNTALLVPSERIVMEVGFNGDIPSSDRLYFRGSVLYEDKKNQWEPITQRMDYAGRPAFDTIQQLTQYKVTLYPTHKRWLYLLDMPFEAPKGATINADLETKLQKNITEVQRYVATSVLSHQTKKVLDTRTGKAALSYDKNANLRSQSRADDIRKEFSTPLERLIAVQSHFKKQELTYTLRPKPLDLNNSTDSFLFDTKRGYCVHFAAAFTTMTRMCEIPSRIATGYKSDGKNSVENYLVIKEKDAHVWVEVYLDSQWKRIESTALAAHIDIGEDEQRQMDSSATTLAKLNLNLLYLKYQIETWILEYSYLRQMKLFEYLRSDILFLIKFILVLLFFIIATVLGWKLLRRQSCEDELLCLLSPVLKKLGKMGYYRKVDESLQQFFTRIQLDHESDKLKRINQQYHQLRYAPDPTFQMHKEFKQLIKEFLQTSP
ncbi:transglutaminaseTgpA domain-containing protein [Sulfurovum sp. CS9]|uniref:transglutaminaseTgpA domain-containing protein n=1 Tax=Sulfurovum sp. CS9 TaxID=3391146 RepID=UPI0039E965E2